MTPFEELLPPVRDQGRRSTCLSIALSDGHLIARGAGPLLSPEHLHFHATKRAGVGLNDAIPLSAGCDALSHDGQTSELACPYSPIPRPPTWTPSGELDPIWRHATVAGSTDILKVVHEEFTKGQSCVLILRINAHFMAGPSKGGVVDDVNGPDRGYHAVLVVDTRLSPGALLVRNCWGSKWGDNGCAWVSEGFLSLRCSEVVSFSGPIA